MVKKQSKIWSKTKNVITGLILASIGVVSGNYLYSAEQKLRKEYNSGTITGVVLGEHYIREHCKESEPATKSMYIIKIKTPNGKLMAITVEDGREVKKEDLETIIEEGSVIAFPKGNVEKYLYGFHEYKTIPEKTSLYRNPNLQSGTKIADRITIYKQ